MKQPSLDIASLALNLDGCRFGDDENRHPNNVIRRGRQQQRRRLEHVVGSDVQQERGEKEKQQMPRQQHQQQHQEITDKNQQQHQQQSLLSPLSTHHRHHLPQYYHNNNNNTTSPITNDDNNYSNYYPPTPQGCTYRFDNLSIGRNFLRHHGTAVHGHSSQKQLLLLHENNPLPLDHSSLIVEECVGRGNCSSVWRARCRRQNNITAATTNSDKNHLGETKIKGNDDDDNNDNIEFYALKFFSLRDPEKRIMLLRELKFLCTFHCDCLVELQGAFLDVEHDVHGNTVAVILEYMDRGSVADLISCVCANPTVDHDVNHLVELGEENTQCQHGKTARTLPEYAIASIAYQILWGLSYLHFEGVLHRDIKPANVLISSSGRVKLADFGIVSRQTLHDNDDGTILHHTVIGTVRYMSPERLHGRPYTRSSDVWSVGLLLLEIVRGGNSPFEDVSSVVELVQTLDECKMRDYIPESSSVGLREMLLGCLSISPHKRIPASVLLQSPWFRHHGINSFDDAPSLMKAYLDSCHSPY